MTFLWLAEGSTASMWLLGRESHEYCTVSNWLRAHTASLWLVWGSHMTSVHCPIGWGLTRFLRDWLGGSHKTSLWLAEGSHGFSLFGWFGVTWLYSNWLRAHTASLWLVGRKSQDYNLWWQGVKRDSRMTAWIGVLIGSEGVTLSLCLCEYLDGSVLLKMVPVWIVGRVAQNRVGRFSTFFANFDRLSKIQRVNK